MANTFGNPQLKPVSAHPTRQRILASPKAETAKDQFADTHIRQR